MPSFKADYLRTLVAELFEKMGAAHDIAQTVADNIIENCLYGHDSHGMALVGRFIKDIELGKIKPDATTEIVKKSPCAVWIDGHRGFGQVTMTDAVNSAVETAKDSGVCAVTVTNCNHIGILWSFARMISEKAMIGAIWCVSGPEGGGGIVAPYGGKGRAIGTNPIAVGIPTGNMKPLVLDISTSAVAGGKVVIHAQQNKKIPLGWLLDKQGNPTTDPNELMKKDGGVAGALLPMAGHKGFGLGLVAEILGGILTGYGASHMPDYREGQGVFIVAVNVETFITLKEFGKQVDRLF